MVRTLTAGGAELRLRSSPNGWCEVEVLLDDKTVRLGADQEEVIVRRLASALDEELKQQAKGIIEGINVIWSLSLAEDHATVFVGDWAGYRILFFQDASGKLLGDIRLTSEDRQRWLLALTGCSE